MTTAEKILNNYIKGDIERDYDEASKKHHTITLEIALKAINQALQQSHINGQLPLSVVEDKIEHFIKYNRKICWEAEMEDGEFCVGENRLRKFVRKLNKP